ncbi:MAG: signal peptide peptidase SppA [Thermoguttaceae bacterium]|nr:signal peptide peptidase SppA [Thermoguttaceae bacterium]
MDQDYSNNPINMNGAPAPHNVPTNLTYIQPAPYGPPAFWKILLKDLLVTVVGVVILGFFLVLVPLLALGVCVGGCVALNKIDSPDFVETVIGGSEDAVQKVVVLPLDGVIESDSADGSSFWTKALKDVKEDADVKALVLRIDSPGGTVSGSAYYHRLIKQLKEEKKIPVVVSMGDMTCSGGYYISMAADELVAEPSTWTGSIGVICSLVNAAELCKKVGVSSNAITSGPMKGMGSVMKEPTEEENAVWQALVDDSYEQFLSVVRDGRPWFRAEDVEDENERAKVAAERDAELRKIADGRVYSANQALERRLIDKIGYLDDTIDVAIERAKLNKDAVRVVVYKEPDSLLSALGVDAKAKKEPLEKAVDAVGTISTPKAYYLCPNALPL